MYKNHLINYRYYSGSTTMKKIFYIFEVSEQTVNYLHLTKNE